MYDVILANQAERDLRRLSPQIFRRVIDEIKSLGEEPRPPGCRKLAGSVSDYRVRVGDYRILYEIQDETREVRIYRVRNRSEAYR
jgi:mRNA interferase RelE/StbE